MKLSASGIPAQIVRVEDAGRYRVAHLSMAGHPVAAMVREGKFREDLYYRLNVINVFLPPLRQRKDDIPLLAQHFLKKYGDENGRP